MNLDENDKLQAGKLPSNPADDAKLVASEAPRILTVQDLLRGARIGADDKRSRSTVTTGNYRLDDITGGMMPGFVWVFGADTSWGKCLGKDTAVMRADGTAALSQDVRDGDRLMGPDSKPRRVLSTTSGVGRLYRINPARGQSWVCNWAHILVVVSTRTGVITEISVEDFLRKTPTWRHQQKLFHVGVDYPAIAEPAIDPWFMGIWYGDGTKDLRSVGITTPDCEVVLGLETQALTWGCHLRENRKPNNLAATYSIAVRHAVGFKGAYNPLLTKMRDVVGDGVTLPHSFTHGSRDVRLRFLAGWIDADGYKKDDHHCEIVTQHEHWSGELVRLCRSLGLQAVVYEKTNVPGYEDRMYHRIQISGDLSVIPTRVKRKQFPTSKPRTNVTRVGFDIEDIGDGEFYGWELEGDGLFLLNDCTVTHNSSWLIMVADENIKAGRRVLIVSAEDSEKIYGDRLMLRRSRISANALRKKSVSIEERQAMLTVESEAQDAPVFLDARGRGVEWVSRNVKQIIKEQEIDLVAFDYLQAFDNEKPQQDRRNQVTYIARTLTDITKSADKTGIIFSQITIEKGKPIPDKHSIRESRDVSNAAEVVLLGFKPEKDMMTSNAAVGDEPLVKAGDRAVFVDKCKNGPRGAILAMPWVEYSACFETVKDPMQKFVDAAGNYDDFDNRADLA